MSQAVIWQNWLLWLFTRNPKIVVVGLLNDPDFLCCQEEAEGCSMWSLQTWFIKPSRILTIIIAVLTYLQLQHNITVALWHIIIHTYALENLIWMQYQIVFMVQTSFLSDMTSMLLGWFQLKQTRMNMELCCWFYAQLVKAWHNILVFLWKQEANDRQSLKDKVYFAEPFHMK